MADTSEKASRLSGLGSKNCCTGPADWSDSRWNLTISHQIRLTCIRPTHSGFQDWSTPIIQDGTGKHKFLWVHFFFSPTRGNDPIWLIFSNGLKPPARNGWPWPNICVYFHHYFGKVPILTNIFEMGWNHQLVRMLLAKISFIEIFHYTCHPGGLLSTAKAGNTFRQVATELANESHGSLGEFSWRFYKGSDKMGNETPMLSGNIKNSTIHIYIYNTICMVILKGFPPIIMHYFGW